MSIVNNHNQHINIELLQARLHSLRQAVNETEELMNRYVTSEQALRNSEDQFRLLVENVRDYAIFMLDVQGHIMTWNAGAQRIKGYAANEIIGKHFSIFYTPEDLQRDKPAYELVVATHEGQYQEEGWRVRKDGSLFWANVLITALFDNNGTLRGFGKVTRDMTERKRAEEERERLRESQLHLEREREARRQMEALLRMQDAFLTTTAHELRTPITSLSAYAELLLRRLKQGHLSIERAERPIKAIHYQAQQLNRLTSALLDITRLEHGKLTLQQHVVDLRTVIERVVSEFVLLVDDREHELNVILPPNPLMIDGDELRLEQIFYNLLQNAFKYSPAGGSVTVELRQEEQCGVVTVTDRGIGIPEQELPLLFDRFYRATNVPPHKISGLGIGLSIVKELVALHGGTIDVQSMPGEGSTFTLRFPLKS